MDIVFISVVRDWQMYAKCIGQNPYVVGQKVPLDNSTENLPIPTRYNRFIENWDFGKEAWLVFCHEDFEPREDIAAKLKALDKGCIYGPVGSKRIGAFGIGQQKILGSIIECNRDGSGASWLVGKTVRTQTRVETLDCCCMIVHSSLVKKYGLRFDENLAFDLYVEDFCATAKVQHRTVTRIVQMKAVHHSGSRATERLFRHLPYLSQKYPDNCFSATCVYFGNRPLLMKLEDFVLGRS